MASRGKVWVRRGASTAALFVSWVFLSGMIDFWHLGFGLVASLAIALLLDNPEGKPWPVFRLVPFAIWLIAGIIRANLRVARLVLTPNSLPRSSVVRIQPPFRDPRSITALGCAITLTPGTLTLDAGENGLLIHALDPLSAKEVQDGEVVRRVGQTFGGTES